VFAACKPPDWQFTHIRVTKLPPHLEAAVPLAFSNGDSLAYAATLALSDSAPQLATRIAWWSGDEPPDWKLECFASVGGDYSGLFAEYVPYGTLVHSDGTPVADDKPQSVN
jgi:hypothetical protein